MQGSVVSEIMLPFGVPDWTPHIQAILASNCYVVVVSLLGTDGQNFLAAFAKFNVARRLASTTFKLNKSECVYV